MLRSHRKWRFEHAQRHRNCRRFRSFSTPIRSSWQQSQNSTVPFCGHQATSRTCSTTWTTPVETTAESLPGDLRATADHPANAPQQLQLQGDSFAWPFVVQPIHEPFLTNKIKKTNTLERFVRLHAVHGTSFNHIHVVASLVRLPKLLLMQDATASSSATATASNDAAQQLFHKLLLQLKQHLRKCGARELSNCLWAVASMPTAASATSTVEITTHILAHLQAPGVLARALPQELSCAAWALVNLQPSQLCTNVIRKIAYVSVHHLAKFDSQALSNLSWALARTDLREATVLEAIASAVSCYDGLMLPQHISTLLWAFAKLKHPHPAMFDTLGTRCEVSARDRSLSPQALAVAAWALAHSPVRAARPLGTLRECSCQHLHSFSPQTLSTLAWGMARGGCMEAAFAAELATACHQQLGQFPPRGLAIVAWALSKAPEAGPPHGQPQQQPPHPVLAGICEAAARQLPRWKSREVVMLLHALAASWPHGASGVLGALGPHWSRILQGACPRDLAVLSRALAVLGVLDHSVSTMLSGRAVQLAPGMNGCELSNTAWALARMGVRSGELWSRIAQGAEVNCQLQQMKAEEVARVAAALASASTPDPNAFTALAHRGATTATTATPLSLACTAYAFACARHSNATLLVALAEEAKRKVLHFSGWQLARLAYGLAVLRHYDGELMSALSGAAAVQLPYCQPLELAMLAWSFASLGQFDNEVIPRALQALSHRVTQGTAAVTPATPETGVTAGTGQAKPASSTAAVMPPVTPPEPAPAVPRSTAGTQAATSAPGAAASVALPTGTGVTLPAEGTGVTPVTPPATGAAAGPTVSPQLLQLVAEASLLASHALQRPLHDLLPAPLHERCRAWRLGARPLPALTPAQQDVAAVLQAAGMQLHIHELVCDKLLHVPVSVTLGSRRVVVEVVGEEGFTSSPPRTPLGSVAARGRCLELQGFSVVLVAAADWAALGSRQLRRNCLIRLLDPHRGTGSGPAAAQRPQLDARRGEADRQRDPWSAAMY